MAVPDLVLGTTAIHVAPGGSHTCVRTGSSQVRCWGAGANGRLGYGNTNDIGDNETPSTAGDVPL